MTALVAFASALAGTAVSAPLSCLPGLHIYNVLGGFFLWVYGSGGGVPLPLEVWLPFLTGLVVGWSIINTIPSVLLGAPDEAAVFTVMPGQKFLMLGRGYEGTMMAAVGGLAGVFLLVFAVGPLAPRVLPLVRAVLAPHTHWVLWVVITYILMSEWPKGGNHGPAGWAKFRDAWRGLAVGLATFLLSGLLGFLVLYRSPVSVDIAFQNIMPVFAGLFAVPWCLFNLLSGTEVPPQRTAPSLEIDGAVVLRAAASGGLGGGFAAFFPVITGGVGGLLAGHATAQRDERVFILSQGASRFVYYVGALLLLFVPGLHLRRGGAAWMIQNVYAARSYYEYYLVLGSIAVAGAAAYLLVSPLTRGVLLLIRRVNYRWASALSLAIVLAIVLGLTGPAGLGLAAVAAGIGSLPVLFGSRRLNCLGVLLLPMACNMSGFGPAVARALGLI